MDISCYFTIIRFVCGLYTHFCLSIIFVPRISFPTKHDSISYCILGLTCSYRHESQFLDSIFFISLNIFVIRGSSYSSTLYEHSLSSPMKCINSDEDDILKRHHRWNASILMSHAYEAVRGNMKLCKKKIKKNCHFIFIFVLFHPNFIISCLK